MDDFIDFGKSVKPEKSDHKIGEFVRPNLRLAKCCLNCYFYKLGKHPMGSCLLPLRKKKYSRLRWEVDPNVENVARVHPTFVCDNHVQNNTVYTRLNDEHKKVMRQAGFVILPGEDETIE